MKVVVAFVCSLMVSSAFGGPVKKYELTKKQKEDFTVVFNHYDTNQDGAVTQEETQWVDLTHDKDGSGDLNLDEFLGSMVANVEWSFGYYDANGNGAISKGEVAENDLAATKADAVASWPLNLEEWATIMSQMSREAVEA